MIRKNWVARFLHLKCDRWFLTRMRNICDLRIHNMEFSHMDKEGLGGWGLILMSVMNSSITYIVAAILFALFFKNLVENNTDLLHKLDNSTKY